MFCSVCGKEVPDNYRFCPACGGSLGAGSPRPTVISRPTGITILAILQLIAGIIFVIAAIGIGALSSMGGMSHFPMTTVLGGFIAAIFGVMALFAFIISGALFSGKRWGRTIVIIFSIIDLIFEAVSIAGGNVFAIGGIILDLVILYYMWRPHVIAYFYRIES